MASSFQSEERNARAVIALSAAMNAGPIEISSMGTQRSIIDVGLVSGWLGATTPESAVIAISNPAIRLIINTAGLQAILPYFNR
jgi:hypothetical protein